ncbi:MAG: hypothetical protein K9N51_13640, partial [Candidatus Pacebacteria bacterium]|nr:hypothetical protein [Candidatus Paceibacterota bacterium]
MTRKRMDHSFAAGAALAIIITGVLAMAQNDTPCLIGYTELRTDVPGGRAANVMTERACVVRADGTGRRELAPKLVANANTWTQFAGWSPDGKQAIVACGWESSENATWEEEHKTFRMVPGAWLLDCYLVDIETGQPFNFAPQWSPDGEWVAFVAGEAVELMRVSL